MNKKKIETFGEFCTLIANQLGDVIHEDGGRPDGTASINQYKKYFETGDYYHHIPPKKKIMFAHFLVRFVEGGKNILRIYEVNKGMYPITKEDYCECERVLDTEFEVDKWLRM